MADLALLKQLFEDVNGILNLMPLVLPTPETPLLSEIECRASEMRERIRLALLQEMEKPQGIPAGKEG